MRRFILRVTTIAGLLLTLGACTDNPTQSSRQQREPDAGRAGPAQDQQVQGCVLEGFCTLDPVSPAPCDPWEDLNWCEGGGDNCMMSVLLPADPTVQSCPDTGGGGGGGTPSPPPNDRTVCPLDAATKLC